MKIYSSTSPEDLKVLVDSANTALGYPNATIETYSYVFWEVAREVWFILIKDEDVATLFPSIAGDVEDFIWNENDFQPQIQTTFGNVRKYICFGNNEDELLGNAEDEPLGSGPEMTADFFNGLNYAYLGQGQNAFGINERPVT